MKYIKWILLMLLIICLIMIGYKYIDLSNEGTNNVDEDIKDSYDISDIYNIHFSRIGVAYYNNNELVSQNYNLNDSRYMFFTNDYVEFCNPMNGICNRYDYVYNKTTITINSENYFVTNGTYDITINDRRIELIQYNGNEMYVYYFEEL